MTVQCSCHNKLLVTVLLRNLMHFVLPLKLQFWWLNCWSYYMSTILPLGLYKIFLSCWSFVQMSLSCKPWINWWFKNIWCKSNQKKITGWGAFFKCIEKSLTDLCWFRLCMNNAFGSLYGLWTYSIKPIY